MRILFRGSANTKPLGLIGLLFLILFGLSGQVCAAKLTTEQKQVVSALKQDLSRIRQEIKRGTKEGELLKTPCFIGSNSQSREG